MFIYEKIDERLLRHFTGSDENEVIRQALIWCDENSWSSTKSSEWPLYLERTRL